MLRKPDFRYIQKHDLGPNAPAWIEVILDPFNDMIQFIIDAFKGNIGVLNLNVQTINFPIEAPFVQTRFLKKKSDRVYTVQIAQILKSDGTPVGAATGINWYEDGTSIVVTDIFGLTNGVRYYCQLMVQYF